MNDEAASVGSFGFAGAWTAAIPNGLILDARLTATDKLLWMVIRCGINNPSVPVSPTYDFLVETSHMARSSVARSLLALRIAGWMTGNTEQRFDGYVLGARYTLHDRDRTDDLKTAPGHREFVAKHVSNKGRIARLAAVVGEQIGLKADEITKAKPIIASSSNLLPPKVGGSSNLGLPKNPENLGSSNLLLSEKSGSSNLELPGSSNLLPSKNGQILGSSNLLPPENQGVTGSPHTGARRSVVVLNNLSSLKTKELNTTTNTAGAPAPARELHYWPSVEHFKNYMERELELIPEDALAQQLIDEFSFRVNEARAPMAVFRSLIAAAIRGTFVLSLKAEVLAASRRRTTGTGAVTRYGGLNANDAIPTLSLIEHARIQESIFPGHLKTELERNRANYSEKHIEQLTQLAEELGVLV